MYIYIVSDGQIHTSYMYAIDILWRSFVMDMLSSLLDFRRIHWCK